MKILFDARHDKGGIGVYGQELLRRFRADADFEVVEVVKKRSGEGRGQLYAGSMCSLKEQFILGRAMLRWSDCIYFSPYLSYPFLHVNRVVGTVHDLNFLTYKNYSTKRFAPTYFRVVTKRLWKDGKGIVAISDATMADLKRIFGPQRRPAVRIYNGVRTMKVGSRPPDLPPSYFVYLGSWKPNKCVPGLVAAYSKYRADKTSSEGPGLLLIGGKGAEDVSAVKHAIRLSPFKQSVTVLDEADEEVVGACLTGALALIHPARFEGFGLTVLEAMKLGVPVISSDGGALPEVCGDAAAMFRSEDWNGLALLMKRAEVDEKWRDDLKARGLRRASLFSWEKCAQETIAFAKTSSLTSTGATES